MSNSAGVGQTKKRDVIVKFPKYDDRYPIEIFLKRVDAWMNIMGIDSETERYQAIQVNLPSKLFAEVQVVDLDGYAQAYTELKRTLTAVYTRWSGCVGSPNGSR